jgi:hypothetical protein
LHPSVSGHDTSEIPHKDMAAERAGAAGIGPQPPAGTGAPQQATERVVPNRR